MPLCITANIELVGPLAPEFSADMSRARALLVVPYPLVMAFWNKLRTCVVGALAAFVMVKTRVIGIPKTLPTVTWKTERMLDVGMLSLIQCIAVLVGESPAGLLFVERSAGRH